MELGGDTKAVLLAAGLIFFAALLLGVWKYRQMAASPDGLAHPYVDTAHRAALLYSFATLLLATFVELSGFSTAVNLIAAFAVIAFFVGYAAIAWLLRYLTTHSVGLFVGYRVALGVLVLVLTAAGAIQSPG